MQCLCGWMYIKRLQEGCGRRTGSFSFLTWQYRVHQQGSLRDTEPFSKLFFFFFLPQYFIFLLNSYNYINNPLFFFISSTWFFFFSYIHDPRICFMIAIFIDPYILTGKRTDMLYNLLLFIFILFYLFFY